MNTDVVTNALMDELQWDEKTALLITRADFRCEYCDLDLLLSLEAYACWEVDHILPKCRDGDDDLENLALSCKTCNSIKGTLEPVGEDRGEKLAWVKSQIKVKLDTKRAELSAICTIAGRK